MELSSRRGLGEDAAQGKIGRIRLDGEGQLGLEMLKGGSGSEGGLKVAEGSICLFRLGKLHSLTSQSSDGRGKGGIMKDKLAVKIGKPQK